MILRGSFFVVIFMKLSLQGSRVLTLKSDVLNNGVCTQSYSYTASHYVPYLETYKEKAWGIFYETKVRVNYKIEYSTQYRSEDVCCDGYEDRDGTCQPICHPTCLHGTCYYPNDCTCYAGYKPRADAADYVCHSICDENCEARNGHCVEPGSCLCDPGYVSTGDERICEPICDHPCVNGVCAAPNRCDCRAGYEHLEDDRSFCRPICPNGCLYGVCVAPDVCECSPGFEALTSNVCRPVCREICVHGKCVAPDTCDCEDGYGLLETSNYVCRPICEKTCINGNCTAPGVCSCRDGFRAIDDEHGASVCKPQCRERCEPHGECTEPNVCKCFDGYQIVRDDDLSNETSSYLADKSVCRPICTEACVNGFCIAPNTCSCDSGYESSVDDGKDVCVPICDPPCGPNGLCAAPNVCVCVEGYWSRRANCTAENCQETCEPACEIPCGVGGNCTGPNVCTCRDGYVGRIVDGLRSKDCPGDGCDVSTNCSCDDENDSTELCLPVCEPPCPLGTCVEPDVCRCVPGKDTDFDCEKLICEENCINGECIAGQCVCSPSFVTRVNGSLIECTNCSKDCLLHGACVDDEGTCECEYGFEGKDCQEPTVCSFLIFDDNITSITVLEEVNSSVVNAYIYSPYCFDCADDYLDQSLCFFAEKSKYYTQRVIRCVVSIDLPCYTPYEYNPLKAVVRTTSIVGGTALLIMCVAFTAAYISLQRSKKRDICRGAAQGSDRREPIGRESLLAEEMTQL